jgi:hypothetical protein
MDVVCDRLYHDGSKCAQARRALIVIVISVATSVPGRSQTAFNRQPPKVPPSTWAKLRQEKDARRDPGQDARQSVRSPFRTSDWNTADPWRKARTCCTTATRTSSANVMYHNNMTDDSDHGRARRPPRICEAVLPICIDSKPVSLLA